MDSVLYLSVIPSSPSRLVLANSVSLQSDASVEVRGRGCCLSSFVRCAGKREKVAAPVKGRPGSGFGAKTAPRIGWDAGVLLRRSEQLYGQLLSDYVMEGEVREFIVCVRQKLNNIKSVFDDWLPVAELVLVSEQEASVALPLALPILCREVAECAAKGAAALRNVSRSNLEYAYEPSEAFYEYVLSGSQVPLSSSECPYAVLGLQKGAPASSIRAAYRSLAAKNHPDRHPGADVSVVEEEFKRVTNAYDQIKRAGLVGTGVLSYTSVGGKARNGLSGPISIDNRKIMAELPEGVKVAVRQLDPEIVSRFLSRLYARSGGASVV